ncbi:MAG: hypothetical protein GY816_11025 [Cytophagales bacterium]|nr:hypothetical protein [Cytophagales bacterium]
MGIQPDESFQDNNNYAIFDCESLLQPLGPKSELDYSKTLKFTSIHQPAMIVICYKIADGKLEKRMFWRDEKEPTRLTRNFIHFLHKISDRNFSYLSKVKFWPYFEKLSLMENIEKKRNLPRYKSIKSVKKALLDYCRRLVVIGYNSGR